MGLLKIQFELSNEEPVNGADDGLGSLNHYHHHGRFFPMEHICGCIVITHHMRNMTW